MFAPDLSIRVQLPARKHPELYCPNDTDIQRLLAESAGTDLEIAILLAAFGPLRRGEICALTSRDIKGNTITVSKSIVRSEDNEWITKSPKTYGSYRTIQMPEFFFKHIRGKKGALCNLNPDQLTREFERVLDLCQLPHFRFHDLRHPYVKPTTKKFASFLKFFRAAAIAARSCSIRYSWLMLPFQISPFLKSPA